MSFPEGPMETGEQSTVDDPDVVDPAPTDGPVATLLTLLRTHVRTWSGRYVEMRTEARTGRRD